MRERERELTAVAEPAEQSSNVGLWDVARATTMACHEGLGGRGDGTIERVRLGDGLEKRDILKFSDKMGLLRVNCMVNHSWVCLSQGFFILIDVALFCWHGVSVLVGVKVVFYASSERNLFSYNNDHI